MDREVLIEAMSKVSHHINGIGMDLTILESIDPASLDVGKPGTRNLVIVMEELAELQQQVSKFLRGKGDIVGLTEEVGDVYLSLRYVELICGLDPDEIKRAMNVKLDRLRATTGIYQ